MTRNSLSLQDIVDSTGGRLIKGVPAKVIGGISIDSRTIKRGDLFVKVTVKIPKKLTHRQRELLEEFKKAESPKKTKKGNLFWQKIKI